MHNDPENQKKLTEWLKHNGHHLYILFEGTMKLKEVHHAWKNEQYFKQAFLLLVAGLAYELSGLVLAIIPIIGFIAPLVVVSGTVMTIIAVLEISALCVIRLYQYFFKK
jgi:hypothetical protein